MTELKACPFCGSNEIKIGRSQRSNRWACCAGCLAEGPFDATEELAIAAWNARAGDSERQPHDWDRATAICQRCGKHAGDADTPTWCAKGKITNDAGDRIAALEAENKRLRKALSYASKVAFREALAER